MVSSKSNCLQHSVFSTLSLRYYASLGRLFSGWYHSNCPELNARGGRMADGAAAGQEDNYLRRTGMLPCGNLGEMAGCKEEGHLPARFWSWASRTRGRSRRLPLAPGAQGPIDSHNHSGGCRLNNVLRRIPIRIFASALISVYLH